MINNFEEVRDAIQKKHPNAKFLDGQCMLFALELKKLAPDAEILISADHCVTVIDGCVYDYNGLMFYPTWLEPRVHDNYMKRTQEFLDEQQS